MLPPHHGVCCTIVYSYAASFRIMQGGTRETYVRNISRALVKGFRMKAGDSYVFRR